MGSYLSDAALFLVDTILGIYILLVLLRFLLQLARADFYNPISQFIVRATNPPLVRLRRFIPSLLGIDLAALALLIAMEALRISLTALLLGHNPNFAGVIFLSLGELGKLTVYTVIFCIFIQALLTWISNGLQYPITNLLGSLTNPILRPIRRMLPADSEIDFSPLIAFVSLVVMLKIIIEPLLDIGKALI